MTRYAPLWQQNSTYPAAVDRGLIAALWPTSASSGMAVTTVAGTMQIQVAPGTAAVALAAGAGSVLCRSDANENVTLTAAPPGGQSRIDVICVQVRDQVLDAGSNNDFVMVAVAGTPASGTPAVPATPANAYPLANVTVPGGAGNLNAATVADRRTPLPGLWPGNVGTYHARVSRTANLVIGNTSPGTPNVLPYDTVDYDPAGMWVPASNWWAAPAAGVYQLAAAAAITVAASQTMYLVAVINSTGVKIAVGAYSSTAATQGTTLITSARLAAGDKIQVGVACTQTGTYTVDPHYVYASLDYLGTG